MDTNVVMAKGKEQCDEQFRQMLEENRQWLYLFILRRTGDADTAEDILQEVFYRVCRNRDRYTDMRAQRAWLGTIAKNLVKNHYRRREAVKNILYLAETVAASRHMGKDTELGEILADENANPEDQCSRKQLAAAVVDAVKNLPEKQRNVIFMRYYADMSVRDIAKCLLVSEGTVKSRTFYALDNLRKTLSQYLIGGRYVMECSNMNLLLPEYASGLLTKEKGVEIEKHMAICEKCRANGEAFRKIISYLGDVENEFRFLMVYQPIDNDKAIMYSRINKGFSDQELQELDEYWKEQLGFCASPQYKVLAMYDGKGRRLPVERITPPISEGKEEPNPIQYRAKFVEPLKEDLVYHAVYEAPANIKKNGGKYTFAMNQCPGAECIQDFVLVLPKAAVIISTYPEKHELLETEDYKLLVWSRYLKKDEYIDVMIDYMLEGFAEESEADEGDSTSVDCDQYRKEKEIFLKMLDHTAEMGTKVRFSLINRSVSEGRAISFSRSLRYFTEHELKELDTWEKEYYSFGTNSNIRILTVYDVDGQLLKAERMTSPAVDGKKESRHVRYRARRAAPLQSPMGEQVIMEGPINTTRNGNEYTFISNQYPGIACVQDFIVALPADARIKSVQPEGYNKVVEGDDQLLIWTVKLERGEGINVKVVYELG